MRYQSGQSPVAAQPTATAMAVALQAMPVAAAIPAAAPRSPIRVRRAATAHAAPPASNANG